MKASGEDIPIPDIKRLHGALDTFRHWKGKTPLGRCMFWREECRRPISSHSLSACWLRKLATADGHVVVFSINARDAGRQAVGMQAERRGVRLVSTFPGFCEKHDNSLFAPLDTLDFDATPSNCLTLAYRPTCQNACSKFQIVGAAMEQPGFLRSPVAHPFETHIVAEMHRTIELLSRKLHIEQCMDGTLPLAEFSHYVLTFKGVLPFVGTATFLPNVTASGRQLAPANDWVSFTLLPTNVGGVAVFSWERSHPKNPSLLMKSIGSVPDVHLADFLLHFMLEHAETVAFSPRWWESLTEGQRLHLRKRAARSIDIPLPTAPRNLFAPNRSPLIGCSAIQRMRM